MLGHVSRNNLANVPSTNGESPVNESVMYFKLFAKSTLADVSSDRMVLKAAVSVCLNKCGRKEYVHRKVTAAIKV